MKHEAFTCMYAHMYVWQAGEWVGRAVRKRKKTRGKCHGTEEEQVSGAGGRRQLVFMIEQMNEH